MLNALNAQKTALLFPGQGAQFAGMGHDLYQTFPEAKQVFDEVDAVLNQNLSKIIFDGNMEELNLTSNTQPAIMAASVAAFTVLARRLDLQIDDMCSLAAGHSLGEYSAHTAAGSFNLADAARLLRARGNAMQSAVPVGKGGMVALVGCDAQKADEICSKASERGLCQVANDNGAGQIVISGAVAAMQYVVENAKTFGVRRAVMLPVSAPFHSSWMQPAADVMAQEFAKVNINTPKVPILANVTVATIADSSQVNQSLVAQVAGKVRWRESIDYMLASGIDIFIEIGPGKVLTNLVSRVNKDVKTYNIMSCESIDTFLKEFENKG